MEGDMVQLGWARLGIDVAQTNKPGKDVSSLKPIWKLITRVWAQPVEKLEPFTAEHDPTVWWLEWRMISF